MVANKNEIVVTPWGSLRPALDSDRLITIGGMSHLLSAKPFAYLHPSYDKYLV